MPRSKVPTKIRRGSWGSTVTHITPFTMCPWRDWCSFPSTMVVRTDAPSTLSRRATTSPVAAKRRKGNMKVLLMMDAVAPAYRDLVRTRSYARERDNALSLPNVHPTRPARARHQPRSAGHDDRAADAVMNHELVQAVSSLYCLSPAPSPGKSLPEKSCFVSGCHQRGRTSRVSLGAFKP